MARKEVQALLKGTARGFLKGRESEQQLRQSVTRGALVRSLFKKEEKEKKLTKTDIKDTKKELLRNFLALEMQKSKGEETLRQKIQPGAQSKFELLNAALVRKDPRFFTKAGKLDLGLLFKRTGLTNENFRAFVKQYYGELEEKIFPTERRLELFRRP